MSLTSSAIARWDVPNTEALHRLVREPLPLGLRAPAAKRTFSRDVYYDTPDHSLKDRNVTCRLRYESNGEMHLTVAFLNEQGTEVERRRAQVPSGHDIQALLTGSTPAAHLLASIINPAQLAPQLELEVERDTREARGRWWWGAQYDVAFDRVTVRAAGIVHAFHEISLYRRRGGQPSGERVANTLSQLWSLRTVTVSRRDRGDQLRLASESEALARKVGQGRWVVVAALDGASIATLTTPGIKRLPSAEGSGEDACRHLLRKTLGSSVGDLRLLTTISGEGRLATLEVWIATHGDRSATPGEGLQLSWLPIEQMLARIGSTEITDPATLAGLTALAKSPILRQLVSRPSADGVEARRHEREAPAAKWKGEGNIPRLNAEESLIAFNARVLALAEDPTVPLLERLRFLAIVSSNMDEFFAVQAGGLKYAGGDSGDESDATRSADSRLANAAHHARLLTDRQYQSASRCLDELPAAGIRVRAMHEVTGAQREHLNTYFRSVVLPYLTPRAITATPGHSLPVVADRALCFAVALREGSDGPLHLAELTVPAALPRFVALPDSSEFVLLEDVIRQELSRVYPGRRVIEAALFRVTRFADLGVDEGRAGDLRQAVQEHAERRRHQPIVRIEVARDMSASVRTLLLRELLLEPGVGTGSLTTTDLYDVPGLMDLEALKQLADLPLPALSFPPARPSSPFSAIPSLWDAIRERDLLVHHPYEDFSSTVVRFFNDAADDPDVPVIKATLYRSGERSAIVDALRRAAAAGKDVTVFVELKARFDESRNVLWTRRLESDGVHVVQGLPGYKNHAKVALVMRRESGQPQRYVHVGTGNYNAGTARVYTDLGMFTARPDICDDITDLFNTLTGSSAPTAVEYRECLVAPHGLRPGLLSRITRETAHAKAGREGRIRMKVNGLSDVEMIEALYRAARAGVFIDLIVRGICTLSIQGLERIRVVSLLGRYLEHARIYMFGNAGDPEYYIGSADLRPRNLRRRVEVLAPVHDAAHQERLARILEVELADPTAWDLTSDGTYIRRGEGLSAPGGAQQVFAGQSALVASASRP
ncbi:MAG: polyphosphate kinase 1 [Gemmatimonadaceae bacterium]